MYLQLSFWSMRLSLLLSGKGEDQRGDAELRSAWWRISFAALCVRALAVFPEGEVPCPPLSATGLPFLSCPGPFLREEAPVPGDLPPDRCSSSFALLRVSPSRRSVEVVASGIRQVGGASLPSSLLYSPLLIPSSRLEKGEGLGSWHLGEQVEQRLANH